MAKEFLKKNKIAILGIVGMTLVSSLPLFVTGIHVGHDLRFHLLRIEAIAKELRDLNIPVRMQSLWTNGYGYPTSIYYGDLLLYIPALLRLAGVSMMAAYKIFVALINFGTALFSLLSFRKIFRNEGIAVTVAFAYITASYRFSNLYIRAAVGEYVAMMFLPVIALAVYRIYTDERSWRRNARLLALGMTGIVTAHILTLEMCVVVLAMVCLLFWKKTFRIQTMKTYGAAALWTFLLNAWFLIPFFDYYKNVSVMINESTGKTGNLVQLNGLTIASFLTYFRNPMKVFMRTPGFVLMAAFLFGLLACCLYPKEKRMRIFAFLSGLTLFLTTTWFPWRILAESGKLGKLLTALQFPWRYLVFADLFLALLLGALLGKKKIGKYSWAVVAICVIITCVYGMDYGSDANLAVYEGTPENGQSYTVTHVDGEGNPTETDELDMYSDPLYLRISMDENGDMILADTSDTGTDILLGSAVRECYFIGENSGLTRTFKVCGGVETDTIELPVFNYKGYHVTDKDGNEFAISDGTNFRIKVEIPTGYEGVLTLCFVEPWYWRLAEIISLFAVAALAMTHFGLKNRRIERIVMFLTLFRGFRDKMLKNFHFFDD